MPEFEIILSPISPEFAEKIKAFKQEWGEKYRKVGAEETPQIDGNGKPIVNKKGNTGYDYIEETYMRDQLDKHFPGWSWEMAAPLQFLGAEWVVAQGHLCIVDENLLPFGVKPAIRRFYGVDSVRIQFSTCPCKNSNKGKPIADCKVCQGTGKQPHTPENIVDVGDNCKQAVTSALKYAINRMCRIGDDIYGKRLEYAGAGSYDSIVSENPAGDTFGNWVTSKKGDWSDIMQILGVKSMSEVTDWGTAYKTVKAKKGW